MKKILIAFILLTMSCSKEVQLSSKIEIVAKGTTLNVNEFVVAKYIDSIKGSYIVSLSKNNIPLYYISKTKLQNYFKLIKFSENGKIIIYTDDLRLSNSIIITGVIINGVGISETSSVTFRNF